MLSYGFIFRFRCITKIEEVYLHLWRYLSMRCQHFSTFSPSESEKCGVRALRLCTALISPAAGFMPCQVFPLSWPFRLSSCLLCPPFSSATGADESSCSVIYGFGCFGTVRTFMAIPAVMKPQSNTGVSVEWLLWSHSAQQRGRLTSVRLLLVCVQTCAVLTQSYIYCFLYIYFQQHLHSLVHWTTELNYVQYNCTFFPS